MRLIWIIVFLGCAAPRYVKDRSLRRWIQTLSVPWVGVLSFLETKKSKGAVAGITLISTKVAMANAREVAVIDKVNIRATTKAMFLTVAGKVQYSTVVDYTLHPEFDEETLNTLALLTLEYDEKKFQWTLMQWPQEWTEMNKHEGNMYVLGYTDRHQALEQVMDKMEFVNKSECLSFYKNEELDSKWLAPTEYQCFRQMFKSEPCVFDSGMVLAAFFKGIWTLLGMSVHGPGCSLPARFIDFARYLPWVEVTTKLTRRRYLPEANREFPIYDKVILEKINDTTIVMRPFSGREVMYGDCNKTIDGNLMYHEESSIVAPDKGIGLYALSMWDEQYVNVNCAMLTVNCIQRSTEPFSFNFSLVQIDWDLKDMIKTVPIGGNTYYIPNKKRIHSNNMLWERWWSQRPINGSKTASVVFKFEFFKEATISVLLYGKRYVKPVPETTTLGVNVTTTTKKRSRLSHPYHIRPQK